jgi:hypothetical protein
VFEREISPQRRQMSGVLNLVLHTARGLTSNTIVDKPLSCPSREAQYYRREAFSPLVQTYTPRQDKSSAEYYDADIDGVTKLTTVEDGREHRGFGGTSRISWDFSFGDADGRASEVGVGSSIDSAK